MRAARLKVIISLTILIAGLMLTVVLLPPASTETTSGVAVDFGERNVIYEGIGSDRPDALSALEYLCERNGMDYEIESGHVISIDGVSPFEDSEWRLFSIQHGSRTWVPESGDPSSVKTDGKTIVCWAYLADGQVPTRAVDETGRCFYGYDVPNRVVSIAPSCTETVCAVGGIDAIVGTDQYSNFPSEVVDRQDDGRIGIVGGFTNPSFEAILKQKPDMVVCIGAQNSHVLMADKLRTAGIDVLVLSGGETVDVVMDNTYMAGVALGNTDMALDAISDAERQIGSVMEVLDSTPDIWDREVMVSLSSMKAPWVSGSGTYISDIMSMTHAQNSYSEESGWVQVNAESIIKNDPEYIIVVSSDYEATQESYDSLIAGLSEEWRTTTAFKTGNIYLFTGDSVDLASRPGPRIAQVTELMSRVIHGDSFDDGIQVPKFIGDEYADYLTFTKEGSA